MLLTDSIPSEGCKNHAESDSYEVIEQYQKVIILIGIVIKVYCELNYIILVNLFPTYKDFIVGRK